MCQYGAVKSASSARTLSYLAKMSSQISGVPVEVGKVLTVKGVTDKESLLTIALVMTIIVSVTVIFTVAVEKLLSLTVGVERTDSVVTVVPGPCPSWTQTKSPGKIWHCGKSREGLKAMN
jgi:hypothetical protein